MNRAVDRGSPAETGMQVEAGNRVETGTIRRLQSIVQGLRHVLSGPVAEFQQLVEDCSDLLQQHELWQAERERMRQAEQNWQRAREQQLAEIQAETARLHAAWDELEDAQRQLLHGQKGAGAAAVQTPRSDTAPMGQVGSDALPANLLPDAWNSSGPAMPSADVPSSGPDTATFQFQQLRREVRKHSRRKS